MRARFFIRTCFYSLAFHYMALQLSLKDIFGPRGLKQQLGYVIFASIIGFLSGGSTYPLCFDVPLLPVVAPFVTFYPIILAYAIVRHRLLDIEVVIKESFIYSCLVIAITVLYSTTIFIGQASRSSKEASAFGWAL